MRISPFRFYIYFLLALSMTGCKISGKISDSSNNGVEGVTLTLSGPENKITTTGTDGTYTFSVSENGTYTITPSMAGQTFTPNSLTKVMSGSAINGVNFELLSSNKPSTLWMDTWQNEDIQLEGYIIDNTLVGSECKILNNIPNEFKLDCSNIPDGKKYGSLKHTMGCFNPDPDFGGRQHWPNDCLDADPVNSLLYFHGEDPVNDDRWDGGFAIVSKQSFNKNKYISAEIVARAYCSGANNEDYCFMGLTLFNGECDYREIAFHSLKNTDTMKLYRWLDDNSVAPGGAVIQADVEQNEYYKIRLDYFPESQKWVYYVNDIVKYIENITDDKLLNDPHVGLFFAGFNAYVEGDVAALKVWNAAYLDQSQPYRQDGNAATIDRWYAQSVFMGTNVANVTKVNLFLIEGYKYVIAAYTDFNNTPSILINEISAMATYNSDTTLKNENGVYVADKTGFQDVPLWVPSRYNKFWIVIKGVNNNPVDFGTSSPGTNYYSGDYKVSNNRGGSWAYSDQRDLYFKTYERK